MHLPGSKATGNAYRTVANKSLCACCSSAFIGPGREKMHPTMFPLNYIFPVNLYVCIYKKKTHLEYSLF